MDVYPLRSVECYCPVTNSWTRLSPLTTPRAYLKICTLKNKIYAIGGLSSELAVPQVVLSSVEVYNGRKNTWKLTTPMNEKRYGGGIC